MWQNPTSPILDEPIKDYKGDVLIISHNKEFCDSVANDPWTMKGSYLRIKESPGLTLGRRWWRYLRRGQE